MSYSPRARNVAIAALVLLGAGYVSVGVFSGADEPVAKLGLGVVSMVLVVEIVVSIIGVVVGAKGASRRVNTSGPVIASVLALVGGVLGWIVGCAWIVLTATTTHGTGAFGF